MRAERRVDRQGRYEREVIDSNFYVNSESINCLKDICGNLRRYGVMRRKAVH